MKRIITLIFGIALLFSCSEEKQEGMAENNENYQNEEAAQEDPHQGMDMANDIHGLQELAGEAEEIKEEDGKLHLADFTLKIPDTWKGIKPTSSMRLREYVIDETYDAYTVKVFYFGNQPSMVTGNIDRWKAEYTDMKDFEELKTKNDKLTAVAISGTFKLKPFPMAQEFTPTENYKTLAAIVSTNEGPYFFKIEGPQDIIDKHQEEFLAFVNSHENM